MTAGSLFGWGMLVGTLMTVAAASIGYAAVQQFQIVRYLRHRDPKLEERPAADRTPNHPVGPATGSSSG